jgi:hypothetical protein
MPPKVPGRSYGTLNNYQKTRMKELKKLSRDEMRNVTGGSLYPACLTGKTCYTVPNGKCSGSSGITCYCTSTTNPGVQSSDPNCSGQTP